MHEALRRIHAALGEDSGLVLVGGAVRDRFLGREGGDWDLASALLPEEVMARAKAAGMKVIATGLQHGTVTVVEAGPSRSPPSAARARIWTAAAPSRCAWAWP